jgi:hypothetical protein
MEYQKMLGIDLQSQSRVIRSINKHLVLILAILGVLFVISQFMILATVGVKGADITKFRAEKEELRIENESLRAEIDSAKVLGQIEAGLQETFDLTQKQVETIRPAGYGDARLIGSLP